MSINNVNSTLNTKILPKIFRPVNEFCGHIESDKIIFFSFEFISFVFLMIAKNTENNEFVHLLVFINSVFDFFF